MRVLAFLPQDGRVEVPRLVPHGLSFSRPASAEALLRAITRHETDVLVLDPMMVRDEAFTGIVANVKSNGMSLVLWGAKDRSLMIRVLKAARIMPVEVALRGFGDEGRLRAIFGSLPDATAEAWLLHQIADRISRLPHGTRAPTTALFCGTPRPESVEDFAKQTGFGSHTIGQRFHRVGIHGLDRFLRVVQLVQTWEPLQNRAARLSEVADAAGYGSVQALTDAYNEFIGMPPKRASVDLDADELVARIVQSLTERKGPRRRRHRR